VEGYQNFGVDGERKGKSMSTADFLAKLSGMNWVEEKYQRDQAISSDAPRVIDGLAVELKGCVDSFNNHYGNEQTPPVTCDAGLGVIAIKRTIKAADQKGSQSPAMSAINISVQYSGKPSVIVITSITKAGQAGTVSAPSVQREIWGFGADESDVFLVNAKGERIEIEQASKIILSRFLFG
jgi:hypothetical protein